MNNKNEENDINYAVIITYCGSNMTRGYTVKANSRSEAFKKLLNHINFDVVSKVEISEIVVDEDMIK